MGVAEVISLEEVRARKHWDALRQQLHTRFDQWLDGLEGQLHEPTPTLAQVTETVWQLRQALTGSLTGTVVQHAHVDELQRQQSRCPQCERLVKARPPVARPVVVPGIDGAFVATPPESARALRCAKYNGTFDKVFARYQQRLKTA